MAPKTICYSPVYNILFHKYNYNLRALNFLIENIYLQCMYITNEYVVVSVLIL